MDSDFINLIRDNRRLIKISLVLGLLLAVSAAIYPISKVARLSIPNNEGFFSLTELKRVKNRLPVESAPLVERESKIDLKKYLREVALEPKWIEKYITATLALTKSDAKDALTNPNEKIDAFRVEWLNVEASSRNEDLARRAVSWIAEVLCKATFRENINQYITAVRSQSDRELKAIYDQLPEIEKLIDQTNENIKMMRVISQKYPESESVQSRLQLNLSAGENKDNLNNLSFITAYLPPLKQLAILETQLAQSIDRKRRLNIEKDLTEVIRETANRELESLDAKTLTELFSGKKIIYEFWSKIDFSKAMPSNAPDWLVNYSAEIKNRLRSDERIQAAHFDRQMTQLDVILTEEKYQRLSLILGGMLAGLILPSIINLLKSQAKRMMRARG